MNSFYFVKDYKILKKSEGKLGVYILYTFMSKNVISMHNLDWGLSKQRLESFTQIPQLIQMDTMANILD